MRHLIHVAGGIVVAAASVAAGAALGGQAREVEPPKMIVANKVTEPVPVAAVVTRLPEVELGPLTIADLKDHVVVRLARAEWEYRELRVDTSPGNYRSIITELGQAGADGWETTGVSFSDIGATVVILKRQKQPAS